MQRVEDGGPCPGLGGALLPEPDPALATARVKTSPGSPLFPSFQPPSVLTASCSLAATFTLALETTSKVFMVAPTPGLRHSGLSAPSLRACPFRYHPVASSPRSPWAHPLFRAPCLRVQLCPLPCCPGTALTKHHPGRRSDRSVWPPSSGRRPEVCAQGPEGREGNWPQPLSCSWEPWAPPGLVGAPIAPMPSSRRLPSGRA